MKKPETANTWLTRAKSNMARAKAGRVSSEILYEDLCFDAQQAVDKPLRAEDFCVKIATREDVLACCGEQEFMRDEKPQKEKEFNLIFDSIFQDTAE